MVLTKQGTTVYPIILPTKSSLRTFNCYLLEKEGSLTLIDAGINTEENWSLFMQVLEQNGFSLNNIDRILLTHNHEDHVGLVNRITSKRDIPVYAHRDSVYRLNREKDFFALRIEFFKKLYDQLGCGENGEKQVQKLKNAVKKNEKNKIQTDIITLDESDTIMGMDVIETPGHAPDHIVFFDKQKKWLFGGDHLIKHISSNALIEPDKNGNRIFPLLSYEKSLEKCLALDVETVFTGHGETVENHKELIVKRLSRIREKAERIQEMIRNGMTIPSKIAQNFYKDKYHSHFSLVMSEILGHLDFLESEKLVEKELVQGVWHYKCCE